MAQKIARDVKTLPETVQAQVLDFVQFLKSRSSPEDADWSILSLAQAMRGIDSEPDLYSESDLKEHFA